MMLNVVDDEDDDDGKFIRTEEKSIYKHEVNVKKCDRKLKKQLIYFFVINRRWYL